MKKSQCAKCKWVLYDDNDIMRCFYRENRVLINGSTHAVDIRNVKDCKHFKEQKEV